MKYIILLCVVMLSGCATELKVHTTDHYKEITPMEKVKVTTETYPEAVAKVVVVEGKPVAAFEKTEMDKLRDFKAKAKKNADVLTGMIEVNDALVMERNALLTMAKAEERRANDLEFELARTEAKLRNEEKARLWESLFYKVIIVLGAAAAL